MRKSNSSFYLAKIIQEGLQAGKRPESFQGHSESSEKNERLWFLIIFWSNVVKLRQY